MLNRIRQEPALFAAFVQAVVAAAVSFGLELTDKQIAGILGVTAAGLALFVRSNVKPVSVDERVLRNERGVSDLAFVVGALIVVVGLAIAFGKI